MTSHDRHRDWRSVTLRGGALRAVMALALTLGLSEMAFAARGGLLAFPPRTASTPPVNPRQGDPQMLVRADRIDYDYTNERVSAVGNVQIYYQGSTIEADKVRPVGR